MTNSRALVLFNGIGRMRTITSLDSFYDDSISYTTTVTSGTNITLPNSGSYTDKDLRVYLGGMFLEVSQDYAYVGVAPRTQIQILRDIYGTATAPDILRFRINQSSDPVSIYDEVVTGSAISSGTPITLPNGKQYNDIELEIFLNGQILEDTFDFNYVGSIPRTQISLTFNLLSTDRLRFRTGD